MSLFSSLRHDIPENLCRAYRLSLQCNRRALQSREEVAPILPHLLPLEVSANLIVLGSGSLHPSGERGELGVLLHPGELNLAGRAVAVLADDDLGDTLV